MILLPNPHTPSPTTMWMHKSRGWRGYPCTHHWMLVIGQSHIPTESHPKWWYRPERRWPYRAIQSTLQYERDEDRCVSGLLHLDGMGERNIPFCWRSTDSDMCWYWSHSSRCFLSHRMGVSNVVGRESSHGFRSISDLIDDTLFSLCKYRENWAYHGSARNGFLSMNMDSTATSSGPPRDPLVTDSVTEEGTVTTKLPEGTSRVVWRPSPDPGIDSMATPPDLISFNFPHSWRPEARLRLEGAANRAVWLWTEGSRRFVFGAKSALVWKAAAEKIVPGDIVKSVSGSKIQLILMFILELGISK